ncbi:MAG: bacteriophage abortive infection AbiH family protein [Paludibacter sp.]|nr:bacteriophage abortive infection AbiH family protein [Paludibacter sp.]
MKMNTLYVIGNGFDLYHELPTRYCHFHKFVKENHKEFDFELEKYFELRIKEDKSPEVSCVEKYLWTNFEEDLGTFDWTAFFDDICNIDINDENFKLSFIYSLEDDIDEQTENLLESIREAFESWLECIDFDFVQKKLSLNENACFLSFNYTLLLEVFYKIQHENILHIHGNIEDNRGAIIFGHNQTVEEEPEFDENGDSNRTPFSDSEAKAKYPFHALSKPVREIIEDNKSFFEDLCLVNKIVVLGHSLNEIDIPYFEEIHRITSNANWLVTYFDEDEKQKHLFTLQEIGIERECISMIKIDELLII